MAFLYRIHHDALMQAPGARVYYEDHKDFNEAFATTFSDEEFDTVGGLILRHLGRVPKRNEVVELEGLRFQVLRADSRRIHSLLVERLPDADAVGG